MGANFFKNLLTLLVVLVVGSLAIEGLVRAFGLVDMTQQQFAQVGLHEAHDTRGYRMTPGFHLDWQWQETGEEIKVDVNSLGMRDIEYEPKKPDEKRILVIGDSFTWGAHGIQLDSTFVKQLGRRLSLETGANYVSMNGGTGGYGNDQSLAFLRESFETLKPDAVVLQVFFGNDVADNMGISDMVVVAGYRMYRHNLGLAKSAGIWTHAKIFLLEHSHLARFFFYKVLINELGQGLMTALVRKNQARNGYASIDDHPLVQVRATLGAMQVPLPPNFEKGYETTEGLLREMRDYLAERHSDFRVVLIPHVMQVNPVERTKYLKQNRIDPAIKIDIDLPSRKFGRICTKLKIRCLDLTETIRKKYAVGEPIFWRTDVHLNKVGHDFVAETLTQDFLKKRN